ncbi:hypothetical protein [Nostocoides australiense]
MRSAPTSRLVAGIAGFGLAAGALTGCGFPERVVGLHDAKVETVDGAGVPEATAVTITQRALAQAGAAFAAKASDTKTHKAILTGPALRIAALPDKYTDEAGTSLKNPATPTILAVSAGRDWPRRILATTLVDGVQWLHVLVSEKPAEAYKLWVTVPMLPGSSVPALPPLSTGTDLVEGNEGLVADPPAVLNAYGHLLDIPAPKDKKWAKLVGVKDPYATGVLAASKAQVKALGKLGTFTRQHDPETKSAESMAFRLADGSALAFGQQQRVDLMKPTSKAKRLDLPSDLASLAGEKSVTKQLRLDWLLTFATVIPKDKAATVIGVSEQLRDIEAK